MKGKQIRPNKGRDEYAIESYQTAHEIAVELDNALRNVSFM